MKTLQEINKTAMQIAAATALLHDMGVVIDPDAAYRDYGLDMPQAGKIATNDAFMAVLSGDQLEIYPHDDPDGHIMIDMTNGATHLGA